MGDSAMGMLELTRAGRSCHSAAGVHRAVHWRWLPICKAVLRRVRRWSLTEIVQAHFSRLSRSGVHRKRTPQIFIFIFFNGPCGLEPVNCIFVFVAVQLVSRCKHVALHGSAILRVARFCINSLDASAALCTTPNPFTAVDL